MFTLSFEEYESIKQFYNKPIHENPLEELNEYILQGGFPRTIQIDNLGDSRTYTQSVIKEIFEKNIKRRIKVRDHDSFEIIRNFIINNFGSLITVNNIVISVKKKWNFHVKSNGKPLYQGFVRCQNHL